MYNGVREDDGEGDVVGEGEGEMVGFGLGEGEGVGGGVGEGKNSVKFTTIGVGVIRG